MPAWSASRAPIETDHPTLARVRDALLGGVDNGPADRRAALEILRAWPQAPAIAQADRAFLDRAVRHAVRNGVTQFLDLGPGLPTLGCTHEVAQAVEPGSRVVYVDNDPLVVAHSRRLLAGVPGVAAVEADFRRPADVIAHPRVRGLLDFSRPIAVIAVCRFLHIADEDDPKRILAGYRDASRPGSLVIFSHVSADDAPVLAAALREVNRNYGLATHPRSYEDIVALLRGYEPVGPGLVPSTEWYAPGEEPVPHQGLVPVYAAVGERRWDPPSGRGPMDGV